MIGRSQCFGEACYVLLQAEVKSESWRLKSPSSALKMETARFSETLAFTNRSTRRFNPKEHQNCHRRENLKYREMLLVCTVYRHPRHEMQRPDAVTLYLAVLSTAVILPVAHLQDDSRESSYFIRFLSHIYHLAVTPQ
jgi:hypothetical protein